MISHTLYLLPTLKLIAFLRFSLAAVVVDLAVVADGEDGTGEAGLEGAGSSVRWEGVVGAVETSEGKESVDEIESDLVELRRGEEERVIDAAIMVAREYESRSDMDEVEAVTVPDRDMEKKRGQ